MIIGFPIFFHLDFRDAIGHTIILFIFYQFDLIDDPNSERFTPIDSNTGLIKLRCPTVIIHPEKDIWLRVTKIC